MKKNKATNVFLLSMAILLSAGLLAGLSALQVDDPSDIYPQLEVGIFVDNKKVEDDERVLLPDIGDFKIIELRYLETNQLYNEKLEVDYSGSQYIEIVDLSSNGLLNKIKVIKHATSQNDFYLSFISPANNINKRVTVVTMVNYVEEIELADLTFYS